MANPDGYNSPVDFRITRTPAPGIKDPVVQQTLNDVYDFAYMVIYTFILYCGIGTIDPSLWSTILPTQTLWQGNLNKLYVIASVNISIGHYVTLFNNAGVLNVKLASGVPGVFQADGYVTSAVVAGDVAEVILSSGLNTVVGSGLTIGQRYWLSNAGNVRTTPDVAAGHLEQYLGIALTADSLWTDIGPAIQH